MKLKIYIGIICLILSSFSISSTKLFKANEQTNLRSVAENTIKTTQYPRSESSQFSWEILKSLKLFKELGLTIFDVSDQLQARKCVDNIENNSDLGPTPYKELWDKCVEINTQFFQKQKLDKKGGSATVLGLDAFNKWDEIIINEYKTLISLSRNEGIKNDCNPLFSKVKGNVYDFLKILQKPDYMGQRIVVDKDSQFISSQYSIYRQSLPNNSFKKLNDASDNLMNAYRESVKSINTQARVIPVAPKLYDKINYSLEKEVIIIFILFYFNLYHIFIYFNFLGTNEKQNE
jgi:hypothetical protein